MTMTIDRDRLHELLDCRGRPVRRASSRLPRPLRAGPDPPARRRADELDDALGRPLPAGRRRSPRALVHLRRRAHVPRLLPGRHRRHGGPLARAHGARRQEAARAGHDHHAALDQRRLGGRGARPALRPALLAGGHDGHRRQPLRPAHRPPHHRPAQGAGLQLVLPRLGRRDVHHHRPRRRPGRAARQRRAGGRREPHHQGRRVQRRRGAREGAGARRRRRRAHRAGADQHRHRAARAGLPWACCGASPARPARCS